MDKIDAQLQQRFTKVFTENHWGGESVSGPGSDPENPMAIAAVAALTTVIPKFGIQSVGDIPCGHYGFISEAIDRFPGLRYVGFDIVEKLVEVNRWQAINRFFHVLDITSSVPAKFDLIFCKELLLHLSNEKIFQALANMRASGSTYFMVSNSFGYPNRELELNHGGYARPTDLVTEPFNFGEPIWRNAFYGLWRL